MALGKALATLAVASGLFLATACQDRSPDVEAARSDSTDTPLTSTAPTPTTGATAAPSTTDPVAAGALAIETTSFTGSVAQDNGVLWVSHDSGTIDRLDPRTGSSLGTLPIRNSSFAARPVFGFGSMWFTTDLDDTLWRVDASSGDVQASLRVPGDVLDNASMSFAPVTVTEDAVWVVSSERSASALHRVDPASSTFTGSLPVPLGANNVAYGFGSFWLTTRENELVRVDPADGRMLATLPLGKYARTLRMGFGSVWTQAIVDDVDTIVRIDPGSNAVVATIGLHPAKDWNLWRVDFAFAHGSVWTCTSESPLVRIDPATNEIVSRYGGAAGGCSLAATEDAVWFGPYSGKQLYRLPLS